MKNLFILLLSFVLFAVPVFAGDLQYDWETSFSKTAVMTTASDKLDNLNPDVIVADDYKGYLDGKNSMYGAFLAVQEQFEELPDTNLNKKYSNLLIDKYHNRLKAISTHTYLAGVIDVPDSEYKILKENLKQLIAIYNYFIAQDI